MLLKDEGTTSLSNTSIENVIIAAVLDGRRVSPCGPDGGPVIGAAVDEELELNASLLAMPGAPFYHPVVLLGIDDPAKT